MPENTDRQTLAAASHNSDDWTDDVWAAWSRTADRAHTTGPKQRVAQLEAEVADLDAKLTVAERQNAELAAEVERLRQKNADYERALGLNEEAAA